MRSDSALPVDLLGRRARGHQALMQRGIARLQRREEAAVETHEPSRQ